MPFASVKNYGTNSWRQVDNGFEKPTANKNQNGLREKLQINEWSFSLFLFCFSLSIVLGKLFVNYGDALQWPIESRDYKLPSVPAFPSISTLPGIPSPNLRFQFSPDRFVAEGEKFINASRRYEKAVSNAVVKFSVRNWAWMRAALSGLAMMVFTWYIVYKDSSVPGINPPSPLNLMKKRGHSKFTMQINYLIGVFNGILIFIYLSL